ncbi:hypothetical protein A6U87_26960 [Rhizobium sp. AC44/96]|uniref:hypothetical protein n=1 Tax=Rhizobium sp. AC44/96 TaxID=1841654 RepID=UPI00080FE5F9|nr:hypothetical protein [Rhizobium sp. AC44/96]OCJ13951.1 hypothetical protein A6U87_26960 [Rhizobium sp. AC44/96]
MTIFIVIPMLLMTLVSAFADGWKTGEVLDVSAIRSVVISGDASSIKISTKPEEPYRAETRGRRDGWFSRWYSSWFFNGCQDQSRMQIEGTKLRIAVASSKWFDLSDCSPEVLANIPPGGAVRVDQQAVMARFDGDFASLGLAAKAADITLQGHVSSVSIDSAAVRAHLVYDRLTADETVAVIAYSIDSYFDFGKDVPVDYTVTAKASLIDSARPSVAGAKPVVTIKAEYARTTIR